MENILSIDSLFANSRATKNPIVMLFLDLKNAFGSVCHQYLFDILQYMKLPSLVIFIIIMTMSHTTKYIHQRDSPLVRLLGGEARSPNQLNISQ